MALLNHTLGGEPVTPGFRFSKEYLAYVTDKATGQTREQPSCMRSWGMGVNGNTTAPLRANTAVQPDAQCRVVRSRTAAGMHWNAAAAHGIMRACL